MTHVARHTSIKARVVAHKQQMVRIDRETRDSLDGRLTGRLLAALKARLPRRRRAASRAITARGWLT